MAGRAEKPIKNNKQKKTINKRIHLLLDVSKFTDMQIKSSILMHGKTRKPHNDYNLIITRYYVGQIKY